MAKEVTIQGVLVSVNEPYAEGHTITAAEAKALNQVRAENIGNLLRKQIQEMKDAAGGDAAAIQEAVQALVNERDAAYQFTLASVGGGATRLDPLTKECRAIAKNFLVAKLREAGITQKEYAEKNGEDAFMSKVVELSDHPEILKAAKKSLAEKEKLAAIGNDLAI